MHYLRTFNPDFPEMELGGNMIFLFSTTSFLSSVILQILAVFSLHSTKLYVLYACGTSLQIF